MKKKTNPIPVETLRKLISYDEKTGDMAWKPRTADMFISKGQRDAHGCCQNWNARYAGQPALANVGRIGYKRGNIFESGYLAHRVAMAMILGNWDFDYVDHIDGNPLNNAAKNLRPCTNAENIRNSVVKAGSSKYKGVCFHKKNRNWIASITVNYKTTHLGSFDTEEKAAACYDDAAKKMHGKFARLNFE
jgi:hypothetical protein